MLNLENLSICYRHFSDHHNLMIPITSVVEDVWNYILSTQGVEGGRLQIWQSKDILSN